MVFFLLLTDVLYPNLIEKSIDLEGETNYSDTAVFKENILVQFEGNH